MKVLAALALSFLLALSMNTARAGDPFPIGDVGDVSFFCPSIATIKTFLKTQSMVGCYEKEPALECTLKGYHDYVGQYRIISCAPPEGFKFPLVYSFVDALGAGT